MGDNIRQGTFYLLIAQILTMFTGTVLHLWVGRFLGPSSYGIYGVVVSLMGVCNVLMTLGMPEAAMKYISEDPDRTPAAIRNITRLQTATMLLFSMVLFLFAFPLAKLLGDLDLGIFIPLLGFVGLLQAQFQLLTQAMIGLKLFEKQAIIKSEYTLFQLFASVIFLAIGLGVMATIIGIITASLSAIWLGRNTLKQFMRGSANCSIREIYGFAFSSLLYAIVISLLLNIEVLAVSNILRNSMLTGYYSAASTIMKIPYYIIGAISMGIYPYISQYTANGDFQSAGALIASLLRYVLMLVVPGVLLVSGTATQLVAFIYTAVYEPAGEPLSLLILGSGLLTVFVVNARVIAFSGKPMVAAGGTLMITVLVIAFCMVFVPGLQLWGAALAMTLGALVGCVMVTGYLVYRFRAFVPVKTLARIGLGSLLVYLLGIGVNVPNGLLPVKYLGILGAYLLVLLALGEVNPADRQLIRSILHLPAKNQGGQAPA